MLRLHVRDLGCSRGERRLFGGLDFAVESGDALVVTGPNGSGKTTLLRIIAGFMPPETGRVTLEGGPEDMALAYVLHFVGHRDGLKGALTVRENLALAPALLGQQGMPVADAAERLELTRARRLPKVDLIRSNAGQKVEPGLVRNADEDLDHIVTMTGPMDLATDAKATLGVPTASWA